MYIYPLSSFARYGSTHLARSTFIYPTYKIVYALEVSSVPSILHIHIVSTLCKAIFATPGLTTRLVEPKLAFGAKSHRITMPNFCLNHVDLVCRHYFVLPRIIVSHDPCAKTARSAQQGAAKGSEGGRSQPHEEPSDAWAMCNAFLHACSYVLRSRISASVSL